MGRTKRAVHVATVQRDYNGRTYRSVLLRRTFREDGKVKHETLGNLSDLSDELVDLIRRALKGETFVSLDEQFEVTRSLPHGHALAALHTLRGCGLSSMISRKRDRQLNLIEAMIVHRVIDPTSKLGCAQALTEETATSSLGELLDLESVNEDELYKAMDSLLKRQPSIEKALAKKHLQEGSLVLYDVTSTYFEGRHCPLARRGHSRDHRPDRPQLVIGLMTDPEGRPIAVEVFEGNTGDPKTVASQIEKLRTRFKITDIVMVGDRGMLTQARIREDLKTRNIDWITALRAEAIQQLFLDRSLQLSLFEETNLAEIEHPDYPGERLMACRNPTLAAERARKREDLLAATERELAKVSAATKRAKRPLRGIDAIALRIGKVSGRFKMAKHFLLDIKEDSFTYRRDQANIDKEAVTDGFYVVRTSVSSDLASSQGVVRAYKSLSRVERVFRTCKASELRIRPVFHRLADRVRAHVLLCMLAYYVEWHMREALAPILFQDSHKDEAEASRLCVVAPAVRSDDAKEKARTKRTDAGEPVQAFRGLLKTLATLTRNTMAFQGATFKKVSAPTPIQSRAFQLLGVSALK